MLYCPEMLVYRRPHNIMLSDKTACADPQMRQLSSFRSFRTR